MDKILAFFGEVLITAVKLAAVLGALAVALPVMILLLIAVAF